jgi:hypothetical protein
MAASSLPTTSAPAEPTLTVTEFSFNQPKRPRANQTSNSSAIKKNRRKGNDARLNIHMAITS